MADGRGLAILSTATAISVLTGAPLPAVDLVEAMAQQTPQTAMEVGLLLTPTTPTAVASRGGVYNTRLLSTAPKAF